MTPRRPSARASRAAPAGPLTGERVLFVRVTNELGDALDAAVTKLREGGEEVSASLLVRRWVRAGIAKIETGGRW